MSSSVFLPCTDEDVHPTWGAAGGRLGDMSPETSFDQLGPYRLERVLGRGGMGTVYAATDDRNGSPAAVKVLSPGLTTDETFRERFVAEIESLKKLRHPHIVRLYGYGEQNGHLFYAMERINGTTLQQELTAGRRFSWREVTRLGIHICGALKHAHDHGVIHRDLKPANLLLDENEHVKLSDFGIAKLFGATQVTAGFGVLGTADYMAPEQAEGRAATPRCDLYSLGSVMYALLAGRPPFSGNSIAEVVYKLRYEQPPSVGRFGAEVPEELERIIDQLLQKEPQQRIPTALALSHRLRAMEHALSITIDESIAPATDGDGKGFSLSGTSISDFGHTDMVPPDIAHRTTVTLPREEPDAAVDAHGEEEDTPAEAHEAEAVAVVDPTRTHYTPVDETTWREESRADTGGSSLLLKCALLLGLVAIGWFLWYASRPPSADQLYARINQTIDEDDPQSFREAEPFVQRFLNRFPEDRRRSDIESLSEDIALYRLEREFEARARRRRPDDSPTPVVDQLYLDAIRPAHADPEAAIVLLEGLINLYGGQPDAPVETQRCVELAQNQLKRLRKDVEATSLPHREMLRERLADAEKLGPDDPQAAAIHRGIIALYGDKRWAADLVQQAHSRLEETKPTPH